VSKVGKLRDGVDGRCDRPQPQSRAVVESAFGAVGAVDSERLRATSTSRLKSGEHRLWIPLGIFLSIIVFATCAFSASYLRRYHAFDQENIIFDADPYYRSLAFSEGWGERSLLHPNLSNYVNPVVRVIERLVRSFFPGTAPAELRMRLSMGISPLFAALTTGLILWIGIMAQVGIVNAVSIAVLFGFSMSTIPLGSVPDHFLISAFLCSLGVVLVQFHNRLGERTRFLLWTLLVTAAAGITISNAVPLLGLFAVSELFNRPGWVAAFGRAAFCGVLAAVLTLVFWASLNWVYGDFSSVHRDQAYGRNVGRVLFYLTDSPARDFFSFPITIGRGFWAGKPDLDRNPPYPKPEIAKYQVAFGYKPPLKQPVFDSVLQLIPFLLITLSLAIGFMVQRQNTLSFTLPAAVFLAFNWLLHSVWGGGAEIFLFSPHWHFASVIALIPLMRFFSSRASTLLLLTGALGMTVVNLLVWYDALVLLPSLALN